MTLSVIQMLLRYAHTCELRYNTVVLWRLWLRVGLGQYCCGSG